MGLDEIFWEIEDYLWTMAFSQPPNSELREWVSKWVGRIDEL